MLKFFYFFILIAKSNSINKDFAQISTKFLLRVCKMFALRVVLAFVLVLSVLGDSNTCSYTDSDGDYFNLSPLTYDPTGAAPSGYQITDSAGFIYYVNFCETVSDLIGSGVCANDGSASCQLSSGNYFNCGLETSLEWVPYECKY